MVKFIERNTIERNGQKEEQTYGSAVFFMIVSFPEDAALAICCSIDRVCLEVRA